MSRRSLLRALTMLVATAPAGAVAAPPTITSEINEVRAANGLRPLRHLPNLARAAKGHSARLASMGTLHHNGFAARIRQAVPGMRRAGENVAWISGCGANAPTEIVRAWMKSPPHRRNILSPAFRLIGTGMSVRGSCDAVFATAEFAG